ncbi:hypothetical protein ACSBR1_038893 [Camellia fascicularis]
MGAKFRAAVAAVSLSLSQSNQSSRRRKMVLEEAQATLQIRKRLGMNCEGRVRNVIKERKVDVMLIQETKRSPIDECFVKSIWPWERTKFLAVDSDRSAEGLLSIWNPDIFTMSESCGYRNFFGYLRCPGTEPELGASG